VNSIFAQNDDVPTPIWVLMLLLFGVGNLAHAADVVSQPTVHVGDVWKYNRMDGFTNEVLHEYVRRVVAVSDSEITIRQETKGQEGVVIIAYDPFWNVIDDGSFKYEPSNGINSFPAIIGKVMKKEYRVKNLKTGSFAACRVSGQYVGWEKVTVPAGTFNALRLEDEIECRGTDAEAAINRTAHKSWYAPVVNRLVRMEEQTTRDGRIRNKQAAELVGYYPAVSVK